MSADMMGIDEDDLYESVEGIISAADFIEKTDGAQIIFI
jgi:peroxiredoxin family protein